MTNVSGSVSAHIRLLTTLTLSDQPNHQLQISEVQGNQKSADPKWNNSRLTYWSTTDLMAGSGTQSGYYVNEHADGDRDFGTFEGNVTINGVEVTLEGTFQFTGGTGKLQGIRGQGNFKGMVLSPTEIQMNWFGILRGRFRRRPRCLTPFANVVALRTGSFEAIFRKLVIKISVANPSFLQKRRHFRGAFSISAIPNVLPETFY